MIQGLLLLCLTLLAFPARAQLPAAPIGYPATHRGGQVDDVHGLRIADPYRWLEDVASADVRAWVAAQTRFTDSLLARLPQHEAVRARLLRHWNYPKLSAPFAAGERLFFYENSGVENQPALYVQDRFDAPPRVLLDANTLSADGSAGIVSEAPSPDGQYFGYGVARQGSDWQELHVRDARTGQDLSDTVRWMKYSRMAWTKDNRGFFYSRWDSDSAARVANPLLPDHAERVFYHRLGHRQSEDQLIFDRPDHPDWLLDARVSEDGQFAVITARRGREPSNRLYFVDLDRPGRPNVAAPIVKLFDAGDAKYEFLSSRGSLFYILTTKDAPHGRIVAVDINAPHPSRWRTIASETYDELVGAVRVGDRLVVHRMQDAISRLAVYDLDGALRGTIGLPGRGTVTEMRGGIDDRDVYVAFTTFVLPPTILRYDFETRTVSAHKLTPPAIEASQYPMTQAFFPTRDGASLGMLISARDGLALDGSHPVLLTGAGSFGDIASPVYSAFVAAWLEMGGVYAVINARGSGAYGRAGYEPAVLTQKPRSIDDFIAAAEFLVARGYTRPERLALAGSGHGGLLVAAALVRRPALFGAALIDAAPLDLSRFDRFTIGWTWTPEYGTPADPSQLASLLRYSPVHNVKPDVRMPPTLITTGDHDDLVAPPHAFKFAATLQATPAAASSPALLHVEPDAGHGRGTAIAHRVNLDVVRLTFLAAALGVTP